MTVFVVDFCSSLVNLILINVALETDIEQYFEREVIACRGSWKKIGAQSPLEEDRSTVAIV